MQLVLVHEKLVTCTKRTPKPLQALSAACPMNFSVEKEPREGTNPHREPSGREGKQVFPCTIASSIAPMHHRICICNVDEASTPWEHVFLPIFAKLPLTLRKRADI